MDFPFPAERCVIEFDDCEAPPVGDPIAASRFRLRQREAADLGLHLQPPTIEHAREILAFAEATRRINGLVLFQCQAGVSRSPAAALLYLAAWTGPGAEANCINTVLAKRSCAVPLRSLIEFGDALLNRGGQLVDAVQRRIGF